MIRRVAAVAIAAAVSLAAPAVAAAPPVKLTRFGVGKVRVGAKHSTLRAKGVLGPKIPGCELSGPDTRAAKLTNGAKGVADLTRQDPRRVRSIVITGGATAMGVGFEDGRTAIEEKFPHAKFDPSTQEVFGITLVTIPKRDGGRFQIGIDTQTEEISVMGVPFIAFCE